MKFTLEIDLENDAFAGPAFRRELTRVVDVAAAGLCDMSADARWAYDRKLMDVNGNTVGFARIVGGEPAVIDAWDDNYVQFARLCEELRAVVTYPQVREAATSMDLRVDDVETLFTRAAIEWQRSKADEPVRQVTPAHEITAFARKEG